GKLSYFSRLMSWYINSIGTYVGLEGHLTAENQISREFFYMTKGHIINDKTLIGGLLGGSQIYKSIGLKFYNSWLGCIEKDAAYIPLFAEDIEDFIYFVMNSGVRFYGFSITMPFKYMPGRRYPVNFYNLPFKQYCNTDVIAFHEGFKKLMIEKHHRVVIVGTGATAESALIALSENEHQMSQVKIFGRNKIRIGQLKFEYKVEAVEKNQKHFDLLINCTPLGFNGENVKDYIGDITFDKVIDLPYVIQNKTPLVQSVDEENCFDGIEFWFAQSRSQMEMFSVPIRRLKNVLT
ncbi:MAG TPA: hypothetical protein PKJ08_09780, partial [Candidatus Cloacimonadota bacterium]|nr:hypothetical protein [Candidatus Cloacimonadota bacterium]